MQIRPIVYDLEQIRSFDTLNGWVDTLIGDANDLQFTLGSNGTFTQGLTVTPTDPASLILNIANGFICQLEPVDQSSYGSLSATTTQVLQLGQSVVTTVTISNGGLSSGQAQYVMIEAGFKQVDAIDPNDPNGGVLPYVNISNPSSPFYGPGNSGIAQDTIRQAVCDIQVKYGTPATAGSEVPPSPDAGYVPVALIALAHGQTTITSGEVLNPNNVAGAQAAPVLAGLLQSHHGGILGQAPGIILTAGQEVQGELPVANMVASNVIGAVSSFRLHSGNPNGALAGNSNINGACDTVYDFTNNILYMCTTTGNSSTTVWTGTNVSTATSFNTQIFTTSGTYTPTNSAKYAKVTVIGGGGGGGTGLTSRGGMGGGGGGGAQANILLSTITTPVAVTIGSGGAAPGGGQGGSGGTSSFAAYLVATGGTGGLRGDGGGTGDGEGGIGSGSVPNLLAVRGSSGMWQSSNAGSAPFNGGMSAFGFGGGGAGLAGVGGQYGGGGGGGVTGGNNPGGIGAAGVVLIEEFIGS